MNEDERPRFSRPPSVLWALALNCGICTTESARNGGLHEQHAPFTRNEPVKRDSAITFNFDVDHGSLCETSPNWVLFHFSRSRIRRFT